MFVYKCFRNKEKLSEMRNTVSTCFVFSMLKELKISIFSGCIMHILFFVAQSLIFSFYVKSLIQFLMSFVMWSSGMLQ